MCIANPSGKIDAALFKDTANFAPEGYTIEFFTSAFRMPVIPGGKDSIKMLESLLKCKCSEVFRSSFLKHYLWYKWV